MTSCALAPDASTGTGSGTVAAECLSLREQLSEVLVPVVHLEIINSNDEPKRLKFAVQVFP